jgi:hypothetical protein|tara:strand:+ start:926 stop:1549 length:624 start_codon:yes stop_codon:yes gene_type:complete
MIQEEYNPEAVEAFAKAGKAIPGQSLTSNPDEPRPFESPPEFTNFKEALDYTVGELLEEEAYMSIVGAIGDGVPIVDLVMQITYVGFREGKWNPDLMLMLVEPLIYTLMSLAEKADIEYRIDDEDDEDDEAPESILEEKAKNIADLARAKMQKTGSVPSGALPTEILQQIEDIKIPEGLLAKPQQTEEVMEEPMTEEPQQSLLNKGQ